MACSFDLLVCWTVNGQEDGEILMRMSFIISTFYQFLGMFAKLWKATVSFVMSLHLSICMEQLSFHWMDFCEIWYLKIFQSSIEKIQVSLKSHKNKGYFTWRPKYIFYLISLFFLEWEMFQTAFVEKIKTHFVFSNFFSKLCHLWDNVEKYCRVGQATWQYGTCTLHAGYLLLQIRTTRLCNTHCFSTATLVAQTLVSVMLYVHCLSDYYWSDSSTLFPSP